MFVDLTWPDVLRIDHTSRPKLSLDLEAVPLLVLHAGDAHLRAELAALVGGHPDLERLSPIDLEDLGRTLRLQRLVFRAAVKIYDQMQPDWPASREHLLAQLVALVERFLRSDAIVITPPLFHSDELRRRLVLALSMNRIVQHLWGQLRFENADRLDVVFNEAHPVRTTTEVPAWYTSKPTVWADRSHLNFCVCDSTWEARAAYILDHDPHVQAWVKNDHLGCEVAYLFNGARRKYRPDFLVRLATGVMLVLEVKGEDDQEQQTKRAFLDEWVRAVNTQGGFGQWLWDVVLDPEDSPRVLAQAAQGSARALAQAV